jgi:hypothetical protein
MRRTIFISALGICLMLAGACGGQEPASKESELAGAAPPPAVPEESSQVTTELMPLDLPVERYVREMANTEIRRAYMEPRGEYIDPRRLIELLREGGAEPTSETAEPVAASAAEEQWPIVSDVQTRAKALAGSGDLEGAVEQWRGLLVDDRAYTVSVEVDCDSNILRTSMETLQSLGAPTFLIPVGIQGRDCYRLCLGVFSKRADAPAWIAKIKLKLPEAVPFVLEVRKGEW